MDVAELLEKQARSYPDKPAVIFRGEPIPFSQLRDISFKIACGLQNLGIKKGDKVAIYLPNCPEYVYSYLGIWCLGATAVPLDFMLTDDELISCLSHCQATVLIANSKPNISWPKIKESCLSLKHIVLSQQDLEGANKAPSVKVGDKDYAIIFYTSGTTGKPKGVLINYRQLAAPPKSMEHFIGDMSAKDIALCSLPFSHIGGLIYIQNCLVYAITVVLMERFMPLEFLRNIPQHKITCFWIVPSMYYALLQLKEFESFDLSTLRWIVIFGAPSSSDLLRRFYQYCPNTHLLHGWGLTETNAPTTVIPRGSEKIGSVGKPAPWIEVKIFSENDKELPAGQVGEIAVRSWVVTDGYYKDPELTAQTIRNSWFYTGDLGKFDADGDLYIVGRKKEMIKVAGEIVFEPEVEAALYKHPAIAEAAVVGVPDKLRGEVPKAILVFKENIKSSEEDLRYFLRQHLAHFKIPHYFEFRESLPKNRAGKIDKEQLRSASLNRA